MGASKLASNVRDLLHSMACQLVRLYKQPPQSSSSKRSNTAGPGAGGAGGQEAQEEPIEVPEDWRQLKPFFINAILTWPTAARPLTVPPLSASLPAHAVCDARY